MIGDSMRRKTKTWRYFVQCCTDTWLHLITPYIDWLTGLHSTMIKCKNPFWNGSADYQYRWKHNRTDPIDHVSVIGHLSGFRWASDDKVFRNVQHSSLYQNSWSKRKQPLWRQGSLWNWNSRRIKRRNAYWRHTVRFWITCWKCTHQIM